HPDHRPLRLHPSGTSVLRRPGASRYASRAGDKGDHPPAANPSLTEGGCAAPPPAHHQFLPGASSPEGAAFHAGRTEHLHRKRVIDRTWAGWVAGGTIRSGPHTQCVQGQTSTPASRHGVANQEGKTC